MNQAQFEEALLSARQNAIKIWMNMQYNTCNLPPLSAAQTRVALRWGRRDDVERERAVVLRSEIQRDLRYRRVRLDSVSLTWEATVRLRPAPSMSARLTMYWHM